MAEAIAIEPARNLPARVAQPVPLDRLANCVQTLDPAARALLDLSLRRGLRDDAIAAIVKHDPFGLAWGRARAIERVAAEMGATGPAALRAVRAALRPRPDEAWGVPQLAPPAPPSAGGRRAAAPPGLRSPEGQPVSVALVKRDEPEPPVIYDARRLRALVVSK